MLKNRSCDVPLPPLSWLTKFVVEFCDHVASMWDMQCHSGKRGRKACAEMDHKTEKPQLIDVTAATEKKKLDVELS